MASKKVTIAVDEKFFKNIFETQRKSLQSQLGVLNLSQTKFTKMISGFKMKPQKKVNFNLKDKKRGTIL